jgi:hypothetical protein
VDSVRVLVCGDRNWGDNEMIGRVMKALPVEGTTLIEGEARGADTAARDWGFYLGWTVERYAADWDKYGKSAGPIRNRQMLDARPDIVFAFHDDIENSRGTKNMVEQATKAGIPVGVFSHR